MGKNYNKRLYICAHMRQMRHLVLALFCTRICIHVCRLCLSKQCVCVCVWHALFHLVCVSVCGQSVCMSRAKSVSVSIAARRLEHCAHLVPGFHRKQTSSEDTWYLFPLQTFEEKQTPEWEGRGFLSAGHHDIKQGLWSSSP